MEMPCVLTIQSGINRPRYPSLSNILRAKQQKIATISASDLQIPEAREEIIRLFPPENKPKGVFLNGTQREKAAQLLKILHEKSFL
jgi:electron transfer flavoprotein beta subunit